MRRRQLPACVACCQCQLRAGLRGLLVNFSQFAKHKRVRMARLWLLTLVVSAAATSPHGGAATAPTSFTFAPAPADNGFHNKSMWSWGGGPLFVDGAYHLFGSAFTNGCGLGSWGSNSVAVRSTSSSLAGPYSFVEIALPHYSHNVKPIVAPDGTFLIFKIGMWPEPEPSKCGDGALSTHDAVTFTHGAETTECWSAPSVTGPWSSVLNANGGLNGRNLFNSTNPAPAFDPDNSGTIYVMGHNGGEMTVSSAPSWRGPYSAPLGVFSSDVDGYVGEDPHLWWQGRWRCIYHMYNKSDTAHQFRIGGYAESTTSDIFGPWTVQANVVPAFTTDFEAYLSGSSGPTSVTTFARRERPFVFPATGAPQMLFTGVCAKTSGSDCFTVAAPVIASGRA